MEHVVQDQIRETEANEKAARDLVGERGHWVSLLRTAPDGREQFGVFSPDGMLHSRTWGEEEAKAAALELAETGKITR